MIERMREVERELREEMNSALEYRDEYSTGKACGFLVAANMIAAAMREEKKNGKVESCDT